MSQVFFADVAADGVIVSSGACNASDLDLQRQPPATTRLLPEHEVKPWTHAYDWATETFVAIEPA